MCVLLLMLFRMTAWGGEEGAGWEERRGTLGGRFNQRCPVIDEEGRALGVNLGGQEMSAG